MNGHRPANHVTTLSTFINAHAMRLVRTTVRRATLHAEMPSRILRCSSTGRTRAYDRSIIEGARRIAVESSYRCIMVLANWNCGEPRGWSCEI